MEADRGLNCNLKFTGVHSTLAYRTREVFIRKGSIATSQLSSSPNFQLNDLSGDDSVARQRTLVGDSLNDEQWRDDLSNSSLN